MFESNCNVGSILENLVHSIVNPIHPLQLHKTWEKGLDASTIDKTIAIEMINWKKGFIHPDRFSSIIENLVNLGSKAKHKIFICAGVQPTRKQRVLLHYYSISLILLPSMSKGIDLWKKMLVKAFTRIGIFTSIEKKAILNDKTIDLPTIVWTADDIYGTNPHEVIAWHIKLKYGLKT